MNTTHAALCMVLYIFLTIFIFNSCFQSNIVTRHNLDLICLHVISVNFIDFILFSYFDLQIMCSLYFIILKR